MPLPMARPTSAWARAAASLIPSPTKTTFRPSAWSLRMASTFPSGLTPARTSGMPRASATRLAGAGWSPVRRTSFRPRAFRAATASWASGLGGSKTAKAARSLVPSTR